MKPIHLLLACAIWATNMYCSCEPRMYTPPARLWPQETSPKPLDAGTSALAAAGGMSFGYCGFDFTAGSGSLTYRRGLPHGLETNATVSYLRLSTSGYGATTGEDRQSFAPSAVSFHLGARYGPRALQRFVSGRLGAGMGFSPVANYAGLDLGTVLGWHNPWVVPFVSPGLYVSFPFNTKRVYVVDLEDRVSGITADEADITWGFEAGGGLKVFVLSKERADPDPWTLGFYVVGKTTSLMSRNRPTDWPTSVGGGIEIGL